MVGHTMMMVADDDHEVEDEQRFVANSRPPILATLSPQCHPSTHMMWCVAGKTLALLVQPPVLHPLSISPRVPPMAWAHWGFLKSDVDQIAAAFHPDNIHHTFPRSLKIPGREP